MSENTGLYVAKTSFVTVLDGQRITVTKGKTRVRAGHPLLEGREHLFRSVEDGVQFEVETARQEPVVPPAPPAPEPGRRTAKKAAAPAPDGE